MKRGQLHLFWIMCFLASMSFANTHIHNVVTEHSDCVKCFAHDIASSADAPILEPLALAPLGSFGSIDFPSSSFQEFSFTSFNARAPPYSF
ncbi:MAG: hypothetical protein NT103_07365 [Campylobacterales bacterium]|nr:hypothetical protein [Campylobacterales bacterium]